MIPLASDPLLLAPPRLPTTRRFHITKRPGSSACNRTRFQHAPTNPHTRAPHARPPPLTPPGVHSANRTQMGAPRQPFTRRPICSLSPGRAHLRLPRRLRLKFTDRCSMDRCTRELGTLNVSAWTVARLVLSSGSRAAYAPTPRSSCAPSRPSLAALSISRSTIS
ncbi:hypothetical protein FKP32DRAFT_384627 [Trametes sanguinea]|nr:hypothetical protein FKP32DRAFT_384627 [Trametes sanguinea]